MHDIIIIGAGIVGLATGLKILESNPDLKILLIEKESQIASHQTGNNSGVIHSGIYYKPGSLKALNCRRGYDLLLEFCNKHNIEYKLTGKLIIAVSSEQIPLLDNIYKRGIENRLTGLKIISEEEIKKIEPNASGIKAIYVPQTGIIDFKKVARTYLDKILELNGKIELNSCVKNIRINTDKCEVVTDRGTYISKLVVSCAGLHSDRIAKLTHPQLDLRIIPFRGEYYKVKNHSIVNGLIYPVPNPAFPFLGVHFTRMINGELEAGPNAVLSFKREGYSKFDFNLKDSFDIFSWLGFYKIAFKYWKVGLGEFYRSFSKRAFVEELKKLVPSITADDLIPGGAGVRAQACSRNGNLLDDFYILESKRVVHVCNAPSPAATASLSIGEQISKSVLNKL
ncbi:L-2-hydroxyglutarate oxidase [Melioribacter sp. OK-6-Me]|uniref:L-2-hydroxyglutarate oxidase n=1 Tax=unclassified Melioribacter TaxID=2627329 RepID=UPI003ED9ACC1